MFSIDLSSNLTTLNGLPKQICLHLNMSQISVELRTIGKF